MALKYLIDTSAATRVSNERVRAVVRALLLDGEICRTTVLDLEMGNQGRNGREWNSLVGSVAEFPRLDLAESHMQRALQVQRMLAERSQRGRKLPDLMVAAVAEQADLIVLHFDADFDIISKATGQQCQWIVPPGTID